MFGEKVKRIRNKPRINIENNANKSIILGEIFGLGDFRPDQSFDTRTYEKKTEKNNVNLSIT